MKIYVFLSVSGNSQKQSMSYFCKKVLFFCLSNFLYEISRTREFFRDAQKAKKNRSSYPGRSRIVKKNFPERGQDIIRTALIFQEKEPSKKCYAIFTRSDFPKFSRFSTISRENPREVTPKNSYFS